MFKIVYAVSDGQGGYLYRHEVMQYGNDMYLMVEGEDIESLYPVLCEVTNYDIERYFPNEMDGLIYDLTRLERSLTDKFKKTHVQEVIGLCQQCRDRNEGQIIFDPFTSRYSPTKEQRAGVANSSSEG